MSVNPQVIDPSAEGPAPPPVVLRRKRPALSRASLYCRRIAFVITIVLVILIVLAGISLVQFLVGLSENHFNSSNPQLVNDNAVTFGASIVVTNKGFLAVNNFQIASHLELPGPMLLVNATPAPVTIPAGGSQKIATNLTIDFDHGPALLLLTHDYSDAADRLVDVAYLNESEFGLLSLGIQYLSNVTWDAPFANMTETLSSLTSEPNGTTAAALSVSFEDHFTLGNLPGVGGELNTTVYSSTGQVCGQSEMFVYALQGDSYSGSSGTFYLQSGCHPQEGTLSSRISGGSFDVPLPWEAIP